MIFLPENGPQLVVGITSKLKFLFEQPFGQIVIFSSLGDVERPGHLAESGPLSAAASCDNHSGSGNRTT